MPAVNTQQSSGRWGKSGRCRVVPPASRHVARTAIYYVAERTPPAVPASDTEALPEQM
jgi:hypothetical protein